MPESDKYNIIVNDSFSFDLTEDKLAQVDIQKLGHGHYHCISNGQSYAIQIKEGEDPKRLEVWINNKSYQIKVEDAQDLLVKALGFSTQAVKKINKIIAPMPGLILDVVVKVGQEISDGDQLVLLEAMKMENVIKAPGIGVIKSIPVNKGDSVDKGQVLLELE